MSTITDDLLERLQADAADTLRAVPSLAKAQILVDNVGDIETRVARALATINDSTGYHGLAVVVLLPEVAEAEAGLPGPPLQVKLEIQVVEQAVPNRTTDKGTGIRSSVAALRVLGALHHRVLGAHALYAREAPIKPLRVKPGYVSHIVTVWARLNGVQGPARPAGTTAWWNPEDSTLVLGCVTPGSEIWYTTDGSLPRPEGETSTLYSGPIADLEPPTTVRAAAYVDGMNPGDVIQLTLEEGDDGEVGNIWENSEGSWEAGD